MSRLRTHIARAAAAWQFANLSLPRLPREGKLSAKTLDGCHGPLLDSASTATSDSMPSDPLSLTLAPTLAPLPAETPAAHRKEKGKPVKTSLLTTHALFALATLLSLALAPPLFSQEITPSDDVAEVIPAASDLEAADGTEVIFSSLSSDPEDRYNSDDFFARPVAGKQAGGGQTEEWVAVRFVPTTDVQATVLMAAIGHISGTKLVNLGLYSNNDILNTVGDPLPGGQGSTHDIPKLGECCQLAKVTLVGEGVTLLAGTKYWLVASPDNVNGSSFSGVWYVSNLTVHADRNPPFLWVHRPGSWPAAQVRGTKLQALSQNAGASIETESSELGSLKRFRIFTNLAPPPTESYNPFAGSFLRGNGVFFQVEIWDGLPFTPKVDVHVTTLSAAIGWKSGTKKINLGIYSDNGGTPGGPLAGGQGTTADIPDAGTCCELTKVKLPHGGVALAAGTQYWLVATPDNVNAPDFDGVWQHSSLAFGADQEPELFQSWTSFSGGWLAAEISGTNP